MRKLSRKDADATAYVEAQGRVIGAIQKAGFETKYPTQRNPNRVIVEVADRKIMVVVWPVVNQALVGLTADRIGDEQADEFWVVGKELTPDLYDDRERFSPELKIMNIAEFEVALNRLQRGERSRVPAKRGATPVRTRVGKTLLVNADELKTAVHCC